ncbi:MAG: hypothetical protein QW407_00890 [Thermofilaceae archaeon]
MGTYACSRLFFALPGCAEGFEVTLRLSNIAEALEAFMMAGLMPARRSRVAGRGAQF